VNYAIVPLICVFVFAIVILAVQSLSNMLFAARDKTERINRRMTMLDSGLRPDEVYAALVRKPEPISESNRTIAELHDKIWTYCRQAGLSVSPTYLVSAVLMAVLGASVSGIFLLNARTTFGSTLDDIALLVACSVLIPLAVWAWIGLKRSARLAILTEQIPLALDIVNRAVRAGHPVVSAIKLAASEMDDPIGTEFGLIVDEITYGVEIKDALSNFAKRTGSADAHFFAVSVGVQFETGGNLVEILSGLAKVIRGRITLAKRVHALASEGRASAYVLSALPVFLVVGLLVLHPSYYTSKFSDPIFWPAVAVVCLIYGLGWIMINRIINIRY